MKPLRATPGWLTVIAVAAVAAVNLAGLWGIRVARQGALEEARRAFDARRRRARERARGAGSSGRALRPRVPRRLADDRAARRGGRDPPAASLLRQAAESALLLFLRSHAEVVRIVRARLRRSARSCTSAGAAGCRCCGSRPRPTGHEGAAIDPTRPRLTARLPQGEAERPLAGGVTIETEVEPAWLLELGGLTGESGPRCQLRDAGGHGDRARRRPAPRRRAGPGAARGQRRRHGARRGLVAAGAAHALLRAAGGDDARRSPSRCGPATARPTR